MFYGPCLEHTEEVETRVLERHGMRAFPLDRVAGRATAAAAEAREALEAGGGPFLVHFDVDVLDFVDCPIADVPHFEHGLSLADAMASLRVLVASPRFAGLVVTEINPDHADAGGCRDRQVRVGAGIGDRRHRDDKPSSEQRRARPIGEYRTKRLRLTPYL